MEFSRSVFPSFTSLRISSPKRVFCHANHGRLKFAASWREKDSCMKPVPASVVIRATMQSRISLSVDAVFQGAYVGDDAYQPVALGQP